MYADFYFDMLHIPDLANAATLVYDALGISNFEERESSNYVGEQYFTADLDGLTYKVALSDDRDAGNLRYWLSIDAETESHTVAGFEQLVTAVATEWLRKSGMRVARVHDFGSKTQRVVMYE